MVVSFIGVMVAETGVPEENHRPVASHLLRLSYKLYHKMLNRHERGSNLQL